MSSRARAFPSWLKKRVSHDPVREEVFTLLKARDLATVCEEAHCPSLAECFAHKHATFMILGDICTRDCRFCAVAHGAPPSLNPKEPTRVAEAAELLGLRHVVITSVTRDDLPDGGAAHFAATIRAVRERCRATIETLTPDFQGRREDLQIVMDASPEVFNHNVETVPSLYNAARPQANYGRSLSILRMAREMNPQTITKSGLMVGLGETHQALQRVFHDLAEVRCDILTIGQYLRPDESRHPVARFLPPEEFDELREEALRAGISSVVSGPFVRSSYMAGGAFAEAAAKRHALR